MIPDVVFRGLVCMNGNDEVWRGIGVELNELLIDLSCRLVGEPVVVWNRFNNEIQSLSIFVKEGEVNSKYVIEMLIGIESWAIKTDWNWIFKPTDESLHSLF